MAATEIANQLATNRCRIVGKAAVVVAQPDDAGPRIVRQRLVIVVRQTNERMMDMHRQCSAVRHNGREMRAGRTADQCDDCLNFGVIRKGFRPGQENSRP